MAEVKGDHNQDSNHGNVRDDDQQHGDLAQANVPIDEHDLRADPADVGVIGLRSGGPGALGGADNLRSKTRSRPDTNRGSTVENGVEIISTQRKTELSARKAPRTKAKDNLTDFTAFKARLSCQPNATYNRSTWKRSRVKPGYLIKRLKSYSPVETEYGVSYLFVLSRKPDKTSADNSVYGLAGYFNWKSLEESGLLVKERKYDRRNKTGN